MNITIGNDILKKVPSFNIIALSMDVCYIEESSEVLELINQYEKKINEEYSLEDVLNIPLIKEARDSYKKFGKDPSRYRLACESLLRRIVKGNKLYTINNLVDIGNILSLECKRSVAVLDYNKIIGDIYIRLGNKQDIYEGINRGIIDVSAIPVYVDSISPFGSTTSDTIRTSITNLTKKILVMIICFSESFIELHKNYLIDLYKGYANAKNIEIIKIKKE